MIITKYRMITETGYIETLDSKEAAQWSLNGGNYKIVTEEIPEA